MDLAEGMLKRALAMDPNNAPAHYLLGSVYRDTNRTPDAQKEFDLFRKLKQ
jgi:cytochrome c-type biogenesis protein CcmH/NrfG